jgi:hypothetical protein
VEPASCLAEQVFSADLGSGLVGRARIACTPAHCVQEKCVQIGHRIAHTTAELMVARAAAPAAPALERFHAHVEECCGLPLSEQFVHVLLFHQRTQMSEPFLPYDCIQL